MKPPITHAPDANANEPLVLRVPHLRAARQLRAAFMDLLHALEDTGPGAVGVLLLQEPGIRDARLEEEWATLGRVLKPQVIRRLHLAVLRGGILREVSGDLDPVLRRHLETDSLRTHEARSGHFPRGEAFHEVLKVLLRQWLVEPGPVTTEWLCRVTGRSYPTVATALKRLGTSLTRRRDRRVELSSFPREEWNRMLVLGDRARGTLRFVDRSGRPRSPEFLLGRVRALSPKHIGVAGVFGARRHHPGLDLLGSPRLDLSIPGTTSRIDTTFVSRIDPGLTLGTNPDETAALVIHLVRRTEPFFETGSEGEIWADPVECLLDLHELRLEAQAQELVEALRRRAGMPQ